MPEVTELQSETEKEMNNSGRPWWFSGLQTFGVPTGLLLLFSWAVWQGLEKWITPQVEANTAAIRSTISTNEKIVSTLIGINKSVSSLSESTNISREVTQALLNSHQQLQKEHKTMLDDLEILKKRQ